MKIDDKIKQGIVDTLVLLYPDCNITISDIKIDVPKDTKHGDYSTNVAMKYCKQCGVNPLELAQSITSNFAYAKYDVEKIEVVKPGFINLFVSKTSLAQNIQTVLDLKDDFGSSTQDGTEVINVEYVSANPTGDLHLGHARQASIGDSITRLYKKAGYQVVREYYVNDAGAQINNLAYSVIARYHQLFDVDYPIPEDGYHGSDIKDIAMMIKTLVKDKYLNDSSAEAFTYFKKTALQYELDKLKSDLKQFRTEFDVWTSEQQLYDSNAVANALQGLKDLGVVYELEGALWLASSKYGDDKDRVLQKSDGSYTYLMPDIANHTQKLLNGSTILFNLFGADHHGYIKRVKTGVELLAQKEDIFNVDIVQMVRLVSDGIEVKMSKRTGNAIGLRELCEDVGVDAVRYFFASRAASSHFDFDLDLAKSRSNDNPVYYAQYAHARMSSIIQIANDLDLGDSYDLSLLCHPKEADLIKHIIEFPVLVSDAAKSRAVHRITNYTHKLASLFHSYYNECKVVNQDDLSLTYARLKLVEACKITIKNSLELVGVHAPERM